jgi:hypothetical protein
MSIPFDTFLKTDHSDFGDYTRNFTRTICRCDSLKHFPPLIGSNELIIVSVYGIPMNSIRKLIKAVLLRRTSNTLRRDR